MSDLTSGHVLTGYIPAKFGDRLVHIDAAHPLAAQLVREYVAPRARPVIVIEGGRYAGQLVDLNECTLDYAMAQLGDYDLVDGDSDAPRIVERVPKQTTVAEDIAAANGSASVVAASSSETPAPVVDTTATETAAPESQSAEVVVVLDGTPLARIDVPVTDRKSRRGGR